jgi:hypothetical protein
MSSVRPSTRSIRTVVHPDGCPAATALLTHQARTVPRPVANQRQRLFGDAGEDKFSHFAVWQAFARIGFDDLGNEVVLEDVHPLLLGAFYRDPGSDHFRQAIDIESYNGQMRLDFLSHVLGPRLCAEDSYLQRQRLQVNPIFFGHLGYQ